MANMDKKNQHNNTKCNICGYPDVVHYLEADEETGKQVRKSHIVQCLGHIGVHPVFWNRAHGSQIPGMRSLGYQDFSKKLTTKQEGKKNAQLQRKKENRSRKEQVHRGH
jgi:hypothetical protein